MLKAHLVWRERRASNSPPFFHQLIRARLNMMYVWQSVYALEDTLKAERGKTTLLSRTRQKITRDGELKTVSDLVTGKESAGFSMLIERDMPELTFEFVALRHAGRFSQIVLDAARKRLCDAGIARELTETRSGSPQRTA